MNDKGRDSVRPLIRLPDSPKPDTVTVVTALSIALILACWVLALRWVEYLDAIKPT
ncbi:hypothetical protein PMI07_000863 [Rhizobium sp. CF080]|uniref:hypothetical protein n=1 Tax=Rhizobium sp. (strain CF080) TaxID=1144310 RepID=UPI000271CD19|nr:hypothetical protein [Rhizobium sp. CF080]EUB97287.1 hypothetical protein PMI07_000863 [Rhizobium sp. CF080]